MSNANQLGMIVEDVRRLATELQNDATDLRSVITKVSNQLEGTFWQGPDAARYRSDWQGQYTSLLTQTAQALEEYSGVAKTNAADQESASS